MFNIYLTYIGKQSKDVLTHGVH